MTSKPINTIARAGLIAKGVVYVILGIIAFMAAFKLGNQDNSDANTKGVFNTIEDLPAGIYLLFIVMAGLICYTIWRFVQAFTLSESSEKKKWGKRLRYIFSGVAYGTLAFTAAKMIMNARTDDKDKNQQIASEILSQSNGQWIAIVVAIIFAGIGAFQIYYGLAEKYRKHVNSLSGTDSKSSLLLRAGKIGYVARGIVWLIVAYLFSQAAIQSNSSKAGDTSKAFDFIESSSFGTYLLGAVAAGVIIYGIFNFIRARYDNLEA